MIDTEDFRAASSGFKQAMLHSFIKVALGDDNLAKRVRALRFFEEAIELAQAMDVDRDTISLLVAYVFDRPKGQVSQEIGGVMVTLAVLCESLGFSMASCYESEGLRLLRMDTSKLRERNKEKEEAGFDKYLPTFDSSLDAIEPSSTSAVPSICPTCSRSDGTHDPSCVEYIPF